MEEFARLMVEGACRGDAYVKYPSWYDIFLLYRVFAPSVLGWTFRLLLSSNGARRSTSLIGTSRPLLESSSPPKHLSGGPRLPATTGRPLLEAGSPPKLLTGGGSPPNFLLTGGSFTFSHQHNPHQHQQKME